MSNPTIKPQSTGIHLMAKPAGPICNLDCQYCFYLEKTHFFDSDQRFLMSEPVLRQYIEQTIQHEPSAEVMFTWQGGEPMLRGLAFYQLAYRYQQELANGKSIRNSLQTNGVLLNETWCEFLASSGFMVGISLDGPKDIHDANRVDKQGRSTFDAVMQAIRLLQKYRIEFNVLVTVTQQVAAQPKQVYAFLKAEGITHIQFNPVVERLPDSAEQSMGLNFAEPAKNLGKENLDMTAQSVTPLGYGEFLTGVFDEWIREDVGRIFVMNFEWALAAWLHLPAGVCLFTENCGRALIMEHNGDIYACDHYMYPDYRLGNIQTHQLADIITAPQQIAFGAAKSANLPTLCRQCEFLFACHGECPKNRFVTTEQGESGLNYLCPSYKHYFGHIRQYMNAMVKLINHQQPVTLIMQALKGPLLIKLTQPET